MSNIVKFPLHKSTQDKGMNPLRRGGRGELRPSESRQSPDLRASVHPIPLATESSRREVNRRPPP